MRTEQKHNLALKRRWRIRKKLSGTKQRPRMSVCFSQKNIHVQFIDDAAGGARYHGKVKALADAAREAGLKF
jgi:ribosomal protein L18